MPDAPKKSDTEKLLEHALKLRGNSHGHVSPAALAMCDVIDHLLALHRRLLDKQPSGNYTNSTTSLLWTAWQASWKASQESIDDKTAPSYRGCHLEPNG